MPSLADGEMSARRVTEEQRHRPRRFLRRGAVTGLADPSAGDPNLQGLQAEWSTEALVQHLERYEIAPRRRQTGGPPVPPILQAHARNRRRVQIVSWLSIGLAAVAAVLVIRALLANVSWPRLPLPRRREKKVTSTIVDAQGVGLVRVQRTWMEVSRLVAVIAFRCLVTLWGGARLIARGSRCLIGLFPSGSLPREMLGNEHLTDALTLLGCAILPTATSALFATILPGGFCHPDANILRFWPPRTRDDIKAILDGWVGLAGNHVKTEGGFAQLARWNFTVRRGLAWMLGVGVWTTVEIYYGPCLYFPLVWRSWFSVLGVSLASWFIANAEALIVKERKSVGRAHVEFAGYLVTLYVARWVDLDGYCTEPGCW